MKAVVYRHLDLAGGAFYGVLLLCALVAGHYKLPEDVAQLQRWVASLWALVDDIDTADDAAAPPYDLVGNPRVDIAGVGTVGTNADMGCYEYQP